jgi:hypothetical protein
MKKAQLSLKEMIQDEKIKGSNFKNLQTQFKDSKEISFIDSLELKFEEKSLKEIIESQKENIELIMIHIESRKSYLLFLFDNETQTEYFIMKNDSIMKNKIFSIKLSQFIESEIQISYIKFDRKNQSKEMIHHSNENYSSKLSKYSSI